MKGWFTQHLQALRNAFRKFAAQGAASLLNVLVIGIGLSLPTAGFVLLSNIQGLTQRYSLEPQMSVFLDTEVGSADRMAIENRLKSEPRIAAVRFVSREEALAQLRKTEGIAEIMSALNKNPLPDAFVVRLSDARPDTLDMLAAQLRTQAGVAQVQADSAWARRLGAMLEVGRLGMALLGSLLAAGLVAATFNTIRLQVLTQREEIEVTKLLGATDAYIRRPFYYLGALQGIGGGLVGLGILAGSLRLLNRGVSALAETYGSSFQLVFLSVGDALAVGIFAGILGWLGAYLSVSIYLRGIEPQ